MNNYIEFQKKQEEKLSNMEIFYAFGNKQLEEGMKKIGAKDISEICSTGSGGYIKKTYTDTLIKTMKNMDEDRKEFLKDDENLLQAFRYELNNHEFCITHDYGPTLESLGMSLESLTEREIKILKQAKKAS